MDFSFKVYELIDLTKLRVHKAEYDVACLWKMKMEKALRYQENKMVSAGREPFFTQNVGEKRVP